MRLLRTEWTRLFARRFTRITLVLILLVLALIGVAVGYSSHQHTAATLAAARVEAQHIREESEAARQRCLDAHKNPSANNREFPPGMNCDDLTTGQPDANDLQPYQFSFRMQASDLVVLLGALLALFGFAVGASFIGAEWSSGGLTNLLLWRPRRLPLLLGKLGTLLLGVLSVGVVLSAAWIAAVWGIAKVRGDAGGVTPGLLRSLALTDTRALALGLFAAAVGFGVASLGRHTATALGVAVGYVVVLEIGARIVLSLIQITRPERFLLSNYVAAWLVKAVPFYDDSACRQPTFGAVSCEPVRWYVHMNQGAVAGGTLLLVVLGAALFAFRRRDVT
ncbi:MAG TPA: ABC transporter permease subunit [Rugosimonospora sp.]|nr:ABC transporter permease subunit [Rugosimonospora sp.]